MKKSLLTLGVALIGFAVNGVAQTAFSENFESVSTPSLPSGWTMTSAGSGWKTNVGSVAWYQWTLPAHTNYVMVNDVAVTADNNSNAVLTSPTFSIPAGSTHAYLSFDYFFLKVYRATGGTGLSEAATVSISTDGGTTWTILDSLKSALAISSTPPWQTDYINVAAYAGMSNLKLKFFYYDGNNDHLCGVAVDNIKVFQPSAADAAVTAVAPVSTSFNAYSLAGGSITLSGTIFNNGYNPITTASVNFKQNSGTVVTMPISTTIAPFTSANFAFTTSYTVPSTTASYNVPIWVTLAGDANASNDSMAATIVSVTSMGTKKLVFEEATGTWCGWCVRGAVFMDSFSKTYPGAAAQIAVHNNDSMSFATANTTYYDQYMTSAIPGFTGFPSIFIDRRAVDDPSSIFTHYANEKNYFAFADITMTKPTVAGNTATTIITVKPLTNLSGDIRLAAVVTESGVKGFVDGATNGWDQHNYYAGGSYGAMGGFESKASVIPGTQMTYDFVARSATEDASNKPIGVAGSLPASMTSGSTYNYTFNIPLAARWNQKNIKINILLVRVSDGVILNSQLSALPAGVSNVSAGVNEFVLFPNPASDNTNVRFSLDQASDVNVTVTDMVGRVVYTTASHMNAGVQTMDLNTANYASGIYNVKIQTTTGSINQQLSVVK